MNWRLTPRNTIRIGLLLVGVVIASLCFYLTFMYGSLSVAPSSVQDHYRFLANLSLYSGIASMVLGVALFFLLGRARLKPS